MCKKSDKSERVRWGPLVEMTWNDPIAINFLTDFSKLVHFKKTFKVKLQNFRMTGKPISMKRVKY